MLNFGLLFKDLLNNKDLSTGAYPHIGNAGPDFSIDIKGADFQAILLVFLHEGSQYGSGAVEDLYFNVSGFFSAVDHVEGLINGVRHDPDLEVFLWAHHSACTHIWLGNNKSFTEQLISPVLSHRSRNDPDNFLFYNDLRFFPAGAVIIGGKASGVKGGKQNGQNYV